LPIEGVSLVPLLQGREDGWPERIIFSSASHQPNPLNRWPGCARSQRFKMVNGTELYDLEADPGEETNVAARHPKELDRLNDAYVRWFESVTTGFTVGHPPIPVGYWEENPAVLTAPQADFSGGIDFFGKNGFAHDFLTGWTSLDAKVSWRITAAAAGRYEVTLLYLCPEGDTGSRIRVSAAGSALEAVVDNPTRMDPIPIEERDNGRYHLNVRHWGRLTAGVVTLPVGESVLEIQALSKKGAEVMQLAKVLLRRL
jgi:arylsulfatase A